MDKEVQGKINQRLQVILSTAQNCIHEIREDADAIELGWILSDLRRVVKNVECICEIMQAAGKNGVGEMKYKVDYQIADSDEVHETVAMQKLRMLNSHVLVKVLEDDTCGELVRGEVLTDSGHVRHDENQNKVVLVFSVGDIVLFDLDRGYAYGLHQIIREVDILAVEVSDEGGVT